DGDWRHPDDTRLVRDFVSLPTQPGRVSVSRGGVCWLLGGFGTGENMAYTDPRLRPLIDEWARRNLAGDEPNVWIDPSPTFAALGATRDVRWWLHATKALRGALDGSDTTARTVLADRLFVLEAYPYPRPTNPRRLLPTHRYTAHLLQEWITSDRPIVIGRARRDWTKLVPELRTASFDGQAMDVRNVQAASISPGNLVGGESAFATLARAISG
ncbi:MAG: hypothetical protein ACRDZ2_10810, partial [Ilumatobacteraceae bacterium]